MFCYTLSMRQPPIRTKNVHEQRVAAELQAEGYMVLKRGWPDFLAVRGNEVRFIEVKPSARCSLSRNQKRVADVLAMLGINVEMAPGRLLKP